MEFSDAYKHDGQCTCSPDGHYIAHSEQSRIIVRHTNTLKLHTAFTAESTILSLQWSPDSTYLLATLRHSHVLQVFSLSTYSFACRVEEPLGFDTAIFASDSRHIVSTSTLHGRTTLYSLTTNHTYVIDNVKHASLVRCSPDGAVLAAVERHNHVDYVGLYSLHTHQPLHHTPLPATDTAHIHWSADSSRLLCIDSPMYGGACSVRAVDGCVEWEWSASGGDESEEVVVVGGVRCGVWSGCGRWLAIGRWDERVELWHVRTWKRVLQWQTTDTVSRTAILYEEKTSEAEVLHAPTSGQENDGALQLDDLLAGDEQQARSSRHRRQWSNSSTASTASTQSRSRQTAPHVTAGSRPSSSASSHPLSASNRPTTVDPVSRATSATTHKSHRAMHASHYCVAQPPFKLPSHATSLPASPFAALSSPANKSTLSFGVSLLSFSPDTAYCCFRLDSHSRCLFILSLATMSLHSVLVQLQPVTDARWQPQSTVRRLLLCGGGKLYGWGEEGCSVTSVPHDGFGVERFDVCGEGCKTAVLLLDEKKFCCVYSK